MDSNDVNSTFTDHIDLLTRTFDGLQGGFGRYIRAWNRAVGEGIAAHTMPTRLHQGALRVRCDAAVWTTELVQMQAEILDRLRRELGDSTPTRLAPYTGSIPARPAESVSEPAIPLPSLDPAEVEALHRVVAAIDDPALRASVLRAMVASHARRRALLPPGRS
jgi:hypothetical protein